MLIRQMEKNAKIAVHILGRLSFYKLYAIAGDCTRRVRISIPSSFSLRPVIRRIACSSGSFSARSRTGHSQDTVFSLQWWYRVWLLHHAASAGSFLRCAAFRTRLPPAGNVRPRWRDVSLPSPPPTIFRFELLRIFCNDFRHYFLLFLMRPSSNICRISASL